MLKSQFPKNLNIFQEMSTEEILDQRKNKFLKIEEEKGFMSDTENLSSLENKKDIISNFLTKIKKYFLCSWSYFININIIDFFFIMIHNNACIFSPIHNNKVHFFSFFFPINLGSFFLISSFFISWGCTTTLKFIKTLI